MLLTAIGSCQPIVYAPNIPEQMKFKIHWQANSMCGYSPHTPRCSGHVSDGNTLPFDVEW
jgi:hypothetical protein